MSKRLAPAGSNRDILAEPAGRVWPRRTVLMCLTGWTVLVGLALWWSLSSSPGRTLWIVHGAGQLQPASAERFHGWFKADFGFQRIYAWILLGPYIALVALYFPLERGGLRLSLPLNLLTCGAFVAASQVINARTRTTFANVTIVKSDPAQGDRETSTVQVRISQLNDFNAETRVASKSVDAADVGLTNLFAQLPAGLRPQPPPSWPRITLWSSLLDFLAYGAIAGLTHSVHFYRRFREREHRALLLESNLAKARLSTLRAQLQPHFLFNCLNAIATLLRRDPRQAEAMLMSLSELLRLSLSQSEKQELTLGEEIKFVERYLEIQRTRFGDKLHIELDIEPAALECLVPALLLQPLVENAIRHGIEPADRDGLVRLAAHRQDTKLVLTVEDDGVGLPGPGGEAAVEAGSAPPGSTTVGTGIGLSNLRARLQMLYGANQSLQIITGAQRGVVVRIEIPWNSEALAELPTPSAF